MRLESSSNGNESCFIPDRTKGKLEESNRCEVEVDLSQMNQNERPTGSWLCCLPCYWLKRNSGFHKMSLTVLTLLVTVLLVASPVLFLISSIPGEKSKGCSHQGEKCSGMENEKQVCGTDECSKAGRRMLASLSWKANPCEDFYQFACGLWENKGKNGESPGQEQSEVQPEKLVNLATLQQQVDRNIEQLLRDAVNSDPFQKVGVFYKSCMREATKKISLEPMIFLLEELGGYVAPRDHPSEDLTDLVLNLLRVNGAPLFDIYLDSDLENSSNWAPFIDLPHSGGFNFAARHRLLFTDEFFRKKGFSGTRDLLGRSERDWKNQGKAYDFIKASIEEKRLLQMEKIMRVFVPRNLTAETRIAETQITLHFANVLTKVFPRVKEVIRNYQRESNKKMAVGELERKLPFIRWQYLLEKYFKMKVSPEDEVFVFSPEYLDDLQRILHRFTFRVVHNGLLLTFASDTLHDLIDTSSIRDRPEFCRKITVSTFAEAVSILYVRQFGQRYTEDLRERMTRIFNSLKNSFEGRIKKLSWLDEQTREAVRKKMAALHIQFLNWPNFWNATYASSLMSNVQVQPGHFFENVIYRYRQLRNVSAGPERGRSEERWAHPFVVNAFYVLTLNTIIIPLALLTQPYFSENVPSYIPYSTVGLIVAHEMLHGFDLKGIGHDFRGNAQSIASQQSRIQFEAKIDCFVKQFSSSLWRKVRFLGSNIDIEFDWNITKNENMADVAGLQLAHEAWRSQSLSEAALPGVSLGPQQLFFLNAAQTYCTLLSPTDYIFLVEVDFHTPQPERFFSYHQGKRHHDEFSCIRRGLQMFRGLPNEPDKKMLYLAMKAEESQILQENSKNFEDLRDEKQKGFPNNVKDCKRKLVITLKVKSTGKIPCDDEYIVVDHVFDPVTGGRGRLLSPVVVKLRQEQMIQLYGLKFQRVVNSDPFEEQKAADKTCSVDPENPTCGIAMYDGTPIPFSEGFCCSCDPHVNAKRQLSPVSHGDSFFYRDSKLISQGNIRFRTEEKTSPIVNPELVRLRTGGSGSTGKKTQRKIGRKFSRGIADPLSWEQLPNFLIEHDRKIVCDKGDFMSELCKLQEEKSKSEGDIAARNYQEGVLSRREGAKEGGTEVENFVLEKPDVTTTAVKAGSVGIGSLGSEQVKNGAVQKGFVKTLNLEQTTFYDVFTEKYMHLKGSRGKRENRNENKKLSLEEKLDRFLSGKHLTKRRKRLLELSRKRFRQAEGQCSSGQECQTAPNYMQDDYVQSPPPKYFFSHDKFIIDPLEPSDAATNTTCKTSNNFAYDYGANVKEKIYQNGGKNEILKSFTGEKTDKLLKPEYYQKQGKGQNKMKVKEKYFVGKIANKKERVSHNEGGRIENSLGRGKANAEGVGEPVRQTASLRGDKRFSLFKGAGEKGAQTMGEDTRGREESLKSAKSRFHGKNLKSFLHKSSEEKKPDKPKIRNFFMARNRERQKFRSEWIKGQKKDEVSHKEAEGFEGKNFKELLKENAKKVESKNNEDKKLDGSEEEKLNLSTPGENSDTIDAMESTEMTESPQNSDKPDAIENTENVPLPESSEKVDALESTTTKFEVPSLEYPPELELPKEESSQESSQGPSAQEPSQGPLQEPSQEPSQEPAKYMFMEKPAHGRPHGQDDVSPDIDFNVEIIHNTYPDVPKHRHHSIVPEMQLKGRSKSQDSIKGKVLDVYSRPGPLKTRLDLFYKPAEKYYIINKDQFLPQDVYLIQGKNIPVDEAANRQHYARESVPSALEALKLSGRVEPEYSPQFYMKPKRRYHGPAVEYSEKESRLRKRQNREGKLQESRGKRYSEFLRRLREGYDIVGNGRQSFRGRGRRKRSAPYSMEPARGFLKSDLNSGKVGERIVHELEICVPRQKAKKAESFDRWTSDLSNWHLSRAKHENLSIDADVVLSLQELQHRFSYPVIASWGTEKREKNSKRSSNKDRLVRSYLNAPDYVLQEVETAMVKGKRQVLDQNKLDGTRGNQTCEKDVFAGEYTQDTAHCMRFGDLWYSLYGLKRPVVAQIMGIQLYDKRSQCDGTSEWRELTKGQMIRVGTFLPKAEDELPSISITFVGGKTKKIQSAIDPENYLLLVPSHVSDPSKANSYPQLDAGAEEYLLVQSKDVSLGGECNMIGTSFEAFARQPDRCAQRRGSCLKRQPVDLWREDMEARIRGKRGKYFVENFGNVPNSPVKTYTNLTGEFLALEYYGEYTSVIEIEVKADSNAIIRKGSNAQIPLVYIDGTYPKKARIILSVLNIGLTASYFRPRLDDCPPDLDPAWCPLEGPLVIIPPHQRHDFKLDLSGSIPGTQTYLTVQVLNQLSQRVAQRKIIIKRGDRCVCAFHCKCNCIGNLVSGKTCRKLSLVDYRKAGYIGSYPFRGGAACSASESILGNVHIVFLTASYVLLFLGVMKGVLGIFFRRIGIAGTRVITGPRQLSNYYESELQCCTVVFDEYGFPVHPTTLQAVQIVPLGIWFLLLSLPCCKVFCVECDSSGHQDEGADSDHKCSSPLLSKHVEPTCVHYNLTTINAKKSKQDEFLPYLPYKGDDDPLEEDDTEFVLQEMKRYRKK